MIQTFLKSRPGGTDCSCALPAIDRQKSRAPQELGSAMQEGLASLVAALHPIGHAVSDVKFRQDTNREARKDRNEDTTIFRNSTLNLAHLNGLRLPQKPIGAQAALVQKTDPKVA